MNNVARFHSKTAHTTFNICTPYLIKMDNNTLTLMNFVTKLWAVTFKTVSDVNICKQHKTLFTFHCCTISRSCCRLFKTEQ